MSHFLVYVEGIRTIPLITTHGWPGSFLEMMKVIPILTDDEGVPFDPVIPSILGFGYSGEGKVEGCNSAFVVDLWQKLMPEGFEL